MVARDQFLGQTLGDIGIGAGVVAIDQRQLDAWRQIFLVLFDVKVDALVHLIAGLGVRVPTWSKSHRL